jgi:hypothetical protein
MEFMEYPKALYLAGQQLVVDNIEQEESARVDGYDDWHADHARTNDTDPHEPEELDRDALKARAAELGIEHARNISTEKLAELIAAAE